MALPTRPPLRWQDTRDKPHALDGTLVHIYAPEKTIVDCFRYRNKIGMDIVIEAFRLWRQRRRKKLDVLLKYARMRHVERAMHPYIEAMP